MEVESPLVRHPFGSYEVLSDKRGSRLRRLDGSVHVLHALGTQPDLAPPVEVEKSGRPGRGHQRQGRPAMVSCHVTPRNNGAKGDRERDGEMEIQGTV